jgi:hypothetical protein
MKGDANAAVYRRAKTGLSQGENGLSQAKNRLRFLPPASCLSIEAENLQTLKLPKPLGVAVLADLEVDALGYNLAMPVQRLQTVRPWFDRVG